MTFVRFLLFSFSEAPALEPFLGDLSFYSTKRAPQELARAANSHPSSRQKNSGTSIIGPNQAGNIESCREVGV